MNTRTTKTTTTTWGEKIARQTEHLAYLVEQVRSQVEAAEANETSQRWAAKLNENVTARNLLYTLSWDTVTMAVDIQRELLLQTLGRRLHDRSLERSDVEIICDFVDEIKDDLLDWQPSRSSSVSTNLVEDAKREAMRDILKGTSSSFGRVVWMADYVERLRAAAPADLDETFNSEAVTA